MTSFFAKCPKCGASYAAGTTCPQCHYSENGPEQGHQESLLTEYGERYRTHFRNYAIFMSLMFGTGVSAVGAIVMFWARRGIGLGAMALDQGDRTAAAGGLWALAFLALVCLGLCCSVGLFFSKRLLPIALNCPKCEVRVDEIGLTDGHCPSCQAKLR